MRCKCVCACKCVRACAWCVTVRACVLECDDVQLHGRIGSTTSQICRCMHLELPHMQRRAAGLRLLAMQAKKDKSAALSTSCSKMMRHTQRRLAAWRATEKDKSAPSLSPSAPACAACHAIHREKQKRTLSLRQLSWHHQRFLFFSLPLRPLRSKELRSVR